MGDQRVVKTGGCTVVELYANTAGMDVNSAAPTAHYSQKGSLVTSEDMRGDKGRPHHVILLNVKIKTELVSLHLWTVDDPTCFVAARTASGTGAGQQHLHHINI